MWSQLMLAGWRGRQEKRSSVANWFSLPGLGSLSYPLDDLVLSRLVGFMEDRPCLNNPAISSHGLKVPVSQTREPSCVPGLLCALFLRTGFFEGFCSLTIFTGVREPSSLVEGPWRLCWSSGWRPLPPPTQRVACWAAYLMGVASFSRNPMLMCWAQLLGALLSPQFQQLLLAKWYLY